MKKLFVLPFVFMLAFANNAKAQIAEASQIIQELYRNYDSLPNITFDVQYTYSSDTLYGDFLHDELMGTYTMSGRKAKFRLGGVEYLQNDSFFIAAYNDQKLILISNATQHAGGFLPMRQAIDSMLQVYSEQYEVNVIPEEDTVGIIEFIGVDTTAMFTRFTIRYNTESNTITGLEYQFWGGYGIFKTEGVDEGVLLEFGHIRRKQTLAVDFVNYRFDNFSDDIYDESNYVWTEDDEWKPVAKYREYRVFNNVSK